MAASLNALIFPHAPGTVADRRMIDVLNVPEHKRSWWRPIVVVGDDAFDPATHKKTGPVTTIEENRVVDTFSIVPLTAQEISDAKDAAVSGLSGSTYKPQLQTLLSIVNDIRQVRTRLNALIDATGQAATVTKFTAGQTAQIDMVQLKAAIKALL